MAFAQLTHRESLRDIESCLRAVSGKLYHLGIRGEVSRSTLAHLLQLATRVGRNLLIPNKAMPASAKS
jgi:hypothetical protein